MVNQHNFSEDNWEQKCQIWCLCHILQNSYAEMVLAASLTMQNVSLTPKDFDCKFYLAKICQDWILRMCCSVFSESQKNKIQWSNSRNLRVMLNKFWTFLGHQNLDVNFLIIFLLCSEYKDFCKSFLVLNLISFSFDFIWHRLLYFLIHRCLLLWVCCSSGCCSSADLNCCMFILVHQILNLMSSLLLSID